MLKRESNIPGAIKMYIISAVFSGGAGGARAPPEFGGSQKGRSLISAYQSLAITTNTPGFEKLNTALSHVFTYVIFFLIFFTWIRSMLTAKVHRGPILKRPIKKILFL